ncbi:MAG TPA: nitroreductase family deazaflavin-dependent oxidoreductase [Candidatus Limnocylindria bacterium]|nr:nitroreductase family deazaflavin-dependent oxidoreductase [Candidatus Limnocylindria bacterium]
MDQRTQDAGGTLSPSRTLALIRRVASPIWRRVGIAAVLEVAGRRTGTPRHVTLIPWEVDGERYLMSLYGATDWVRNLRAAGRGELRHKGRTEPFAAIEVVGSERDRVISVFNAKTPKPFRRDFERRPAAGDHPTFRMEPTV